MAGIPKEEAGRVWRAMREAGVRSLHFGELQARCIRRRQWALGLSLALSSGAALAPLQHWWAALGAVLAGSAAVASAWAIVTSTDRELVMLSALRTAWESLRIDCASLWLQRREDGAQERLEVLQRRANDLEAMANAGGPWDRRTLTRWEGFVSTGVRADAPWRAAPDGSLSGPSKRPLRVRRPC